MCDKQETLATKNGMETHEKLFTTESELNIISIYVRAKRKEINTSPKPGRTSVRNIFRDMLNGIL